MAGGVPRILWLVGSKECFIKFERVRSVNLLIRCARAAVKELMILWSASLSLLGDSPGKDQRLVNGEHREKQKRYWDGLTGKGKGPADICKALDKNEFVLPILKPIGTIQYHLLIYIHSKICLLDLLNLANLVREVKISGLSDVSADFNASISTDMRWAYTLGESCIGATPM